MTRSRFAKVSLISVLVLSLVLFLWNLSQKEETSAPPIIKKTFRYPLSIKGISYSTYDDNNNLIARIEADELKVKPKKFFVFNIRPFNEAILTNVRLEVHLYEDMPSKASDVNLLSFGEDILSLDKDGKSLSKEIGLITRGVIKGFVLEIYKADTPSILIKAKKAYIDFRRKKIKMIEVSMKDISSGKLIRSRSIIWNNKEKVFNIPGEYIARTGDGIKSGKRIKVDLDFAITPF